MFLPHYYRVVGTACTLQHKSSLLACLPNCHVQRAHLLPYRRLWAHAFLLVKLRQERHANGTNSINDMNDYSRHRQVPQPFIINILSSPGLSVGIPHSSFTSIPTFSLANSSSNNLTPSSQLSLPASGVSNVPPKHSTTCYHTPHIHLRSNRAFDRYVVLSFTS